MSKPLEDRDAWAPLTPEAIWDSLNETERQVALLIAAPLPHAAIARRMGARWTERLVKCYVERIANKANLAAELRQSGLVGRYITRIVLLGRRAA